MKVCTRCLQELPHEAFAIDRAKPSGRRSHCKECLKRYAESYRRSLPDGELAARLAQYKRRHRELVNATNRRLYASRRPVIKAGQFSGKDWADTLDRQQNRCFYCGDGFTVESFPTVDHVIPISKGGTHDPQNIVAACISCNAQKGDKIVVNLISTSRL